MEPNYGYTPQAYTQPDPSPPEPPKKNRTVLIVSIIAAAVVLVAAIVAGAIVLSGGGNTTTPTAPSITSSQDPVAAQPPSDTPDFSDAAFYQAVSEQGLYLTSPRSDVIELGRTTCSYLQASKSFTGAVDILTDQLDPADAAYFIGASVAAFCPELDYLLPN